MMTTATMIKQSYQMNSFFVVFRSIVLLSNSLSKLLTIDVHITLLLELGLHTCMHADNRICDFMF